MMAGVAYEKGSALWYGELPLSLIAAAGESLRSGNFTSILMDTVEP